MTMDSLSLRAPAKLNLYLHILRKRADGFHDINTLFEKVAVCDIIKLTKQRSGIKVSCAHKAVPENQKNLAYQAAKLLLETAGSSAGVAIKITKKIPVAAGLGGGSSDAAAVLVGLNRLFKLNQSQSTLLRLGEKIGSDVPFLVKDYVRAIGRGKGERLKPVKLKQRFWYVLIVPNFKVSTRMMYQDPRIILTKRASHVRLVLRSLRKTDLTALNKYSYNSFTPVLTKKYKQINSIIKALKTSGALATLISGSGPCVFGVAGNRKEAMAIARKIRATGKCWQVIVTKTYDAQ